MVAAVIDYRLPGDLIAPFPPHVPSRGISESERPFARSVSSNLGQMWIHCNTYCQAIALMEVSAESSHAVALAREEAGHPRSPESLWSDWKMIAAKSAVFAARNFDRAMYGVVRDVGKVESWKKEPYLKGFEDARSKFSDIFPEISAARDAAAHPETFAIPSVDMSIQKGIPGFISMSGGGSLIMSDGLVGNKYSTTFKKKLVQVELSIDTARVLVKLTRQAFEIFGTPF